ncbi:MAG: DNA helicase RecQ [Candidatus Competibacterales bacterium]
MIGKAPSSARASAQGVLKTVFGYTQFRGQQQAVVERVIEGGDALVLMPTGGGKSLCYQVPALVRPGTAVVVSPLIALMEDQVHALRQLGVKAAYLNSSLEHGKVRAVEQSLVEGTLDLLYVAPERLVTERCLTLLRRIPLALFAIDEAHCVSQWGFDFRPEYTQLSCLPEHFPGVPRIALTATADATTREDIRHQLSLGSAEVFLSSFDRPNITYQVLPKQQPRQQLLAFLAGQRGAAGIVYCLARKTVDATAQWLAEAGYPALPYHAGLDAATRRRHQRRFLREEGVIMVATVAFGMGIDKPDVRFVAHLDLPKSLEGYYQETGRAGRDGLPAEAWLAYGLSDAVGVRKLLAESTAPERQKRIERQKLDAMLGYCETTRCRRQVLLHYFGEDHPGGCGRCDTCLEPPATWDATVVAQKALSCVYRTGQRFGVGYLVDVLMGKDNERIRRFNHHQVSTFAIGQELSASEWRTVYRQLVALGLLTVDVGGYGGLQLTAVARPVLRGEQTLHLRQEAPRAKAPPPAVATAPRPGVETLDDEGRGLWEALRQCRLALAKEQGVPPYVIFHDATLLDMVARRPATLEAFGQVAGVGQRKRERYGEAFLAVIAAHDPGRAGASRGDRPMTP